MSAKKRDQSPQTASRPHGPRDAPSGGGRGPNPAALAVPDAARVLTAAGAKNATEANVAADVAAGAPTNADGTINLLHYAAWLARRVTKQASPQ